MVSYDMLSWLCFYIIQFYVIFTLIPLQYCAYSLHHTTIRYARVLQFRKGCTSTFHGKGYIQEISSKQ